MTEGYHLKYNNCKDDHKKIQEKKNISVSFVKFCFLNYFFTFWYALTSTVKFPNDGYIVSMPYP